MASIPRSVLRLAASAGLAATLAAGCTGDGTGAAGTSTAPPPAPPPSAVSPPAAAAAAPSASPPTTGGVAGAAPAAPGVVEEGTPPLPNETEPGWVYDDAVGQAWLLDPCRPTEYPTDPARQSFRSVTKQGPEAVDARQSAAYPSVDVAVDAVAGFRRALSACSSGSHPDGTTWRWSTEELPGVGDEGFLAAGVDGVGPGSAPSGERIAVVRVGATVFLAYASGEYGTAEIDGGARAVEQVARGHAGPL